MGSKRSGEGGTRSSRPPCSEAQGQLRATGERRLTHQSVPVALPGRLSILAEEGETRARLEVFDDASFGVSRRERLARERFEGSTESVNRGGSEEAGLDDVVGLAVSLNVRRVDEVERCESRSQLAPSVSRKKTYSSCWRGADWRDRS